MQLLLKQTLLLLLFFTLNITSYAVCPDLDIDGENNICAVNNSFSNLYYYNVNYNLYSEIEWEIKNGLPVVIDNSDVSYFQNQGGSYQTILNSNDEYTIKVKWSAFDGLTIGYSTQSPYITEVFESMATYITSIFNGSSAQTLGIIWDGNKNNQYLTAHVHGAGFLGVCGSNVYTKYINKITDFNISLSTNTPTNLLCNQATNVNAIYTNNASYSWSTNGASVGSNWGSGLYIDHFTKVGNVEISLTGSNACGTKTSKIIYNITPPDYGEVQQNGINVSGANSNYVKPDCQGNFYLGIPKWVSNYCTYTWELPNQYDPQTNIYSIRKVTGLNLLNVSGKLPSNGLTDFVGKVTITGLCGDPVVKTFVIKPTLRPTIDPDFYSCVNTTTIQVNNPNGLTNINPWVVSSTNGTWGNFANNTPTTSIFNASGPGNYVVKVGLTDANNCYVELNTNIHIGSVGFSGINNNAVNGWQAGVLSDNRMRVGSNLVAYGNVIYFEGRDGKIYYYTFDNALKKWIINQVPGITNVALPAYGAFNKINLSFINNTPYLFYADNTGLLKKVNLLTNLVDDPLFQNQITLLNNNSFEVRDTDIFWVNNLSILRTQNDIIGIVQSNCTLKSLLPGKGLIYIQNNNLFLTDQNRQLTYSNDITQNSDVIYFNGYLYFTKGLVGNANLYRMDMGGSNNVETITTSSNLSGKFSINFVSGVIYYGVLGTTSPFTTYTVGSGTYRSANIYQAHLSSGVWLTNQATNTKPVEGTDMLIHSPIYVGNHLFYIGAGHNSVIGGAFELEVWNLFYESNCTPNLMRVATIQKSENLVDTEESSIDIYPNPFLNELIIQLGTENKQEENIDIKVYDAAGNLIFNDTLFQSQTINTENWASGMYVVKITQGGQVINKKLIKVN